MCIRDREKAEKARKRAEEEAAVAGLVAAARATPVGECKDVATLDLPKGYSPPFVEAAWYEWWEARGFFAPAENTDKPPFVMVIPPPNVTGALHMGHALTNSIEDTITRWNRMRGRPTLWVPGTDHAGIATQTVVEKQLQRDEGITRHELGREAFLQRVWAWKEDYGGRILRQLRRLGSSVDWTREAFTMDENLSKAVREAFARLHAEGLIYRDNRLVNWCCRLKTAVSDIEVDHVDVTGRTMLAVPGYEKPVEFGVLTRFAYRVEGFEGAADDPKGEVVFATTRPETMLGDTAVAVHPDDPRYTHLHGRRVVHPVLGRSIPIVLDAELVDMTFGTGCVKITPAHDPNDFATGKRHNLEFINILDDSGCLNDKCGPFTGQPRFAARAAVCAWMMDHGLHRGVEDNAMSIPVCSRSKDVIEPVLKPQWWVNCADMAANASKAVREGDIEIVPKEQEQTWYRWLDNIRDWCISRQLWWGHRIPAYYVRIEGRAEDGEAGPGTPGTPWERMDRWVVAKSDDEALAAGRAMFPDADPSSVTVHQDEDVLDTWFSSGLFPFSVFGWPDQTPDLARFYPTSLLETGHDILFFWVARMVMMGIKLTGKAPFQTVYLHSMVRDAHGRKMSKSLGNVIDPVSVIDGISLEDLGKSLEGGNIPAAEIAKAKAGQKQDFPDGIPECGTDAMRFALLAYTSQARDVNLDIQRVAGYRQWCNKLWNALKFASGYFPPGYAAPSVAAGEGLPFMCRWALHELADCCDKVTIGMETYQFSQCTDALYAFFLYRLCDVVIETAKPVFAGDDVAAQDATRAVLWTCLETGLRLLHPFMPFLTEELWQRLPLPADGGRAESIMIAPWPEAPEGWRDATTVATFADLGSAAASVRQLLAAYNVPKQARPAVTVVCRDDARRARLVATANDVAALASCGAVTVVAETAEAPEGCGVAILDDVTSVHVLLAGLLDPVQEVTRLEKAVQTSRAAVEALRAKQAALGYRDKTPAAVQAAEDAKVAAQGGELAGLEEALEQMKKLALAG